MNRGELWTAAGGKYYASKPRPVLIIQADRFDATNSVTICPITSDPTELPLLRIPLTPEDIAGLTQSSSIMVDNVTTGPRSQLSEHIGTVSDTTMLALSRAVIVFLGIA